MVPLLLSAKPLLEFHGALVALGVFAAAYLLLGAWPQLAGRGDWIAPRLWIWVLPLVSVAPLVTLARYAASPFYFDHVEIRNAAVAWLYALGEPLYHAPDIANLYALPYGPLLAVVPALPMRLLGPSIASSKLAAVLAAAATMPLFGWLLARRSGARAPLWLPVTALLATQVLPATYLLWNRAEPFLLLATAGATGAAMLRDRRAALLLAGGFAAFGCGFKIHAVLMFLPALALLGERHGARVAATAAALAALLTLAPFALPGVSLTQFLYWARFQNEGHGVDPDSVRYCVHYLVPALLPLTAAMIAHPRPRRFCREHRWLLVALAVAVAGSFRFGSLAGSREYVFYPLLPVFAYILALALAEGARRRRFFAAAVLATLGMGLLAQAAFIGYFADRFAMYAWVPRAEQDVRRFMAAHPGETVSVGYGYDVVLNDYRVIPLFGGNRFYIDENLVTDYARMGRPLPAATYAALESCRNRYWLMRKGTPGFGFYSFFTGNAQIFPAEFDAAFKRAYRKDGETEMYEVWRCIK